MKNLIKKLYNSINGSICETLKGDAIDRFLDQLEDNMTKDEQIDLFISIAEANAESWIESRAEAEDFDEDECNEQMETELAEIRRVMK
jgi:hypothetical protein